MTDVLVLVEHADGVVSNNTNELITAGRVFGSVGAVVDVSYKHLTLPTILLV